MLVLVVLLGNNVGNGNRGNGAGGNKVGLDNRGGAQGNDIGNNNVGNGNFGMFSVYPHAFLIHLRIESLTIYATISFANGVWLSMIHNHRNFILLLVYVYNVRI